MAKSKKKKDDKEVFWKIIFPGLLFLLAIIAYAAVPRVNQFFFEISAGWLGLVILLALGALLFLWYSKLYNMSRKAKFYVISVILFTIFCIWTLANHEVIFTALEDTLGVWGMSGVLLALCLALLIVMKILF